MWADESLADEFRNLQYRRMFSRKMSDTLSLGEPVSIEIGGGSSVLARQEQSLHAVTSPVGLPSDPSSSSSSTDALILSTSCPSDEGYCSPGHRGARVLTRAMTQQEESKKKVFKVVLTGGPCGGKTTGQERLATFFENMGWKVYTVPETATVLLSGGVKFAELTAEQAYQFQKDLLVTLLRIEDVFINQAVLETKKRVLIICDRGAMDPSAYIDAESWKRMLEEEKLEMFNLRENRYDQIVHMVTAADGAERHYTQANNKSRSEGIHQALEQDKLTRNVWLGHPYVDVIDNVETPSFEDKIRRLIEVIADRTGVEVSDRLKLNSKKRKWLVLEVDESKFPKFEEFEVKHDYLTTERQELQVRLRSRCQNNRTTYTLTTRTCDPNDGIVETRMQLSLKDYQSYYRLKDKTRQTIHKQRRCFSFGVQYFNLDIYVDPLPPACLGKRLMILETYTTKPKGDPEPALPDFLVVEREITGDADFSMYSLSYITRGGSLPPPGLHPSASVAVSTPMGELEKGGKTSASYEDLKKTMHEEKECREKGGSESPEPDVRTAELLYNEDADDA